MLTASPLDPHFNGGQPIVNLSSPPDAPATATSLNSGTAVAVQKDGKIIVVGAIVQPSGSTGKDGLAVRRYNADGTLDTTFGSNGEADVALPSVTFNAVLASSRVAIQPDGGIVFAADLATRSATIDLPDYPYRYTSVETVAVRLTSAGTPDASFGTGGEVVISTMAANLTQLALDSNGKIVLAGFVTPPNSNSNYTTAAVTRLNADGSTDASFNGGNLVTRDLSAYSSDGAQVLLALTPTSNNVVLVESLLDGGPMTPNYVVAEYTTSGTLNSAFGSGGTIQGTNNYEVNGVTVQSDGKVLVVGRTLLRFNADGSADKTFANPSVASGTGAIAVQTDGKILVGAGSFELTRFTASGVTDGSFGPSGTVHFAIAAPPSEGSFDTLDQPIASIALTASGQAVAVGTQRDDYRVYSPGYLSTYPRSSQLVVAQFKSTNPVAGDYDGDGRADIAAEITASALFAYRRSNGTGDVVQPFGQPGLGNSIPLSGDFDGDGKADVAVYLPALGEFAYRPSSGGGDVVVPFGPAGVGASIPCPGDYFGTGVTAMAVYIPSQGNFAIRGPNGVGNKLIPFGTKGVGASIPVPGDYDGDGKTDIAVYLTATGTFAYRTSATSSSVQDVLFQFGPAGVGNSIPAPGDYDGDGITDMAVYIPAQGEFAVHPGNSVVNYLYPSGTTNYLVPFGVKGTNGSIPAPGDYDGDGKTDFAVYIPSQGVFAYRPSTGGLDAVQQFGTVGTGQTIPASALPLSQPSGGSGNTSAVGVNVAALSAVYIPLTDDLLSPTATAKKKTGTTLG